jgi:ribonuclease HI
VLQSCGVGSGIGIVLVSPQGATFELSFLIEATATNNLAEYQALLKGIRLLQEIRADAVEIFGDSMLVVNQLIGIYECKDDILRVYHEECCRLLKEFKKVTIEHVPKLYNGDANRLAQHASGYRLMEDVMTLDLHDDDWRKEIVEYLGSPSKKVS